MCISTLQLPYTGTISFLALQIRWTVTDLLVSGYTMQKPDRLGVCEHRWNWQKMFRILPYLRNNSGAGFILLTLNYLRGKRYQLLYTYRHYRSTSIDQEAGQPFKNITTIGTPIQ